MGWIDGGELMEREALLVRARTAARRAYAPYSRFRVGAAVVARDAAGERVFTGANVENASYGLTLCAERAALAAAALAVPRGGRRAGESPAATAEPDAPQRPRITQVAVACIDAEPDDPASLRTPCGACRQWLAELAPDAEYYVDGVPGALRLDDLLPLAFRLDGALPPHRRES